jgi:hypothetical protein
LNTRDELPDLKAIVMYGEKPVEHSVISWQELLNIGAAGALFTTLPFYSVIGKIETRRKKCCVEKWNQNRN